MTPSEQLGRSHRILAIVTLALAAYWPTFHVGFLWDDHVMIEANPALRQWSAQTLKHDFTTDVFDGHGDPYYRPAQTILNRVDYTLWGLRPIGYHLTNWVGHALNAVLLAELALALGFGNLVALLVGCLFAVHPMPVEQLIIIAGRAEIFGYAFLLVSLLLLLRKERWAWILGYAAYVLALLFKESALATPIFLAILYYYRHEPRSSYWRLVPYGVLAVPYLAMRRSAVGPLMPLFGVRYISKFFIEAFAQVPLIYARLILVPWNLHSHRMMPHLTHAWPILDILFIGLGIYLFRSKSRLGFLGLGWFLAALLPKVPIMIYGNFMLDHWAYPASFGILLPMAVGYAWLWEGRRNRYRYWLGLTFFPVLIFWALLVHLNVALRGTDEKMYRWALHFTDSHPIQYNLGLLLLQTGRAFEALNYLAEYHRLYPEDPQGTVALAEAYAAVGHTKACVYLLHDVIKHYPSYLPAARDLEKIRSGYLKNP